LSDQIMACLRRAQATLRARVTDLVHGSVGDDEAGQILINQFADRFPDPEPEEPPVPPMERPTPTWTPPAPPEPAPGSAAPGRNDVFIPEEPTDEDLYYQRRSWLE